MNEKGSKPHMKKLFALLFRPETRRARWLMVALLVALCIPALMGHLDPVKQFLDSEALTFKVGDFSLSLYRLLVSVGALLVLFWVAGLVSVSGERRLKRLRKIRASNRALLTKAFQIGVYFIAFLIGLDVVGIDLTAFAVLGGAVGIGIGFGLQKITSNFISGLILLFEKSMEEGDLIELADGTYGSVKYTGARYTLIETFDSKEIMVPNEDFITNPVTNWTYSNKKGRVDITVGVSYESDIELARDLILQAAIEHPRCSKDPVPQCFLMEFADSSVNFLLYFWVDDVTEGRNEPRSDVLRSLWKKFKAHNIGIPYPQRDVHLINPEALKND